MKVFVRKWNSIKQVYEKSGPFPVIKISRATDGSGDHYHVFLIQDGTDLRTVGEDRVELATPLDEALE